MAKKILLCGFSYTLLILFVIIVNNYINDSNIISNNTKYLLSNVTKVIAIIGTIGVICFAIYSARIGNNNMNALFGNVTKVVVVLVGIMAIVLIYLFLTNTIRK
jgi:hypothetical protein